MERSEIRERIVNEAKSWIGTPYHHEARVKGAGVDCGMLLLEVYERSGLIPHIVPFHYSPDFMLHRNEEWYIKLISEHADEIVCEPYLPGDAVVMRNGRTFSHGGIVISWPLIIHASSPDKFVTYGDMSRFPLSEKTKKIFRHRRLI
jgi:cell wall-associated NlpC family hydrolase